jgi:hypothetical protein
MSVRLTRRRLAFSLLALATLGGGYLWWLVSDRGPLTKANCSRIHEGIPIDEVVAILGPPDGTAHQGDASTGKVYPFCYTWTTDTADVTVLVDKAGLVQKATYQRIPNRRLDPLRVLWWRVFRGASPF